MAKARQIEDAIDAWGGLEAIASEFRVLKKSTLRLSGNKPRLIDNFPNQWVGIYNGEVCAHADSFNELVSALRELDFPMNRIIIRYISKYRRAMFL